MAEKSPAVQPIRQRVVLTAALLHVDLHFQNDADKDDGGENLVGFRNVGGDVGHFEICCTVSESGRLRVADSPALHT